MSDVSGERVVDSDQGSCEGGAPERCKRKSDVMSEWKVGVPQRETARAGETVREVGE